MIFPPQKKKKKEIVCPTAQLQCIALSNNNIRTHFGHSVLVEKKRMDALKQRFRTFLIPGTGFMEENFYTDRGWGIAGLCGDGSGGNESNRERANEALLAH